MSTDNPDPHSSPDSGPRHPAQHFADQHSEFIVNPPPVGRRISAFAASISVVASIAVLAIAIPEGIGEYSEATDQTPASSVPKKGSSSGVWYQVVNGKTVSSALSLGNGHWLVALESVDNDNAMHLATSEGQDIPVSVVAVLVEMGTAILRTTVNKASGPALQTQSFVKPDEISDFSGYKAVDGIDESPAVKGPSLSLTAPMAGRDVPIGNPDCLQGVALLVEDNVSRGIIVHRQHSAWVLGTTSINKIMEFVTARQ